MKSKTKQITRKNISKTLRGSGRCNSCEMCFIRMQKKPRAWALIAETKLRQFSLKDDRVIYSTIGSASQKKGEILFEDIDETQPINIDRSRNKSEPSSNRSYEVTIKMKSGKGSPYRLANVGKKCKKGYTKNFECSVNQIVNTWYTCLKKKYNIWLTKHKNKQRAMKAQISRHKELTKDQIKKTLPDIKNTMSKLNKNYQKILKTLDELKKTGVDINKVKGKDHENNIYFIDKFENLKQDAIKELTELSSTSIKSAQKLQKIGGLSGRSSPILESSLPLIPESPVTGLQSQTRVRRVKRPTQRQLLLQQRMEEARKLRERLQASQSAFV